MKVAAIKKPGGFGNLQIEGHADPVAGSGEILWHNRYRPAGLAGIFL